MLSLFYFRALLVSAIIGAFSLLVLEKERSFFRSSDRIGAKRFRSREDGERLRSAASSTILYTIDIHKRVSGLTILGDKSPDHPFGRSLLYYFAGPVKFACYGLQTPLPEPRSAPVRVLFKITYTSEDYRWPGVGFQPAINSRAARLSFSSSKLA